MSRAYTITEPAHDKFTIKVVGPAKTPLSLVTVFADRMRFLQPSAYPKRDKREPLPYWVDVQADVCLCWSHRSYCIFCRALSDMSLIVLMKTRKTPIGIMDGFFKTVNQKENLGRRPPARMDIAILQTPSKEEKTISRKNSITEQNLAIIATGRANKPTQLVFYINL